MKIIVGTPRTGTSFVAQWYANQTPNSVYHMPKKLGEYFHPDFYHTDDVDQETQDRIHTLTDDSVFKLHTGTEMSDVIWDFIADKPVILVERNDKFQQFLSYGIGYLTDKWASFDAEGNNGLSHTGHYQRQWFDELAQRLVEFDNRKFLCETHIWYEDIYTMPANGKLPFKQNIGDKLAAFDNKEEIYEWFTDFSTRTGLGDKQLLV
jgi:hypothetical protein